MLKDILKQLGLSEKESLIYLSSLELGTQPVSVIAKKATLKRTTTYVTLVGLISRGLVSQHAKKNLKYFSATDPKNLLKLLEREKEVFIEKETLLKNSLVNFYKLIQPQTVAPKVRYFEGVQGIKQVMEDTLTSKTPLCCYSTIDKWYAREDLKKYILNYGMDRVKKKKLPLRSILTDTPLTRDYLKVYPKNKSKKLSESRWLPKGIEPFTNEINIYDDKIAICSLDGKELLGIIIESKEIANTQRSIFELSWKSAIPAPKLYDK